MPDDGPTPPDPQDGPNRSGWARIRQARVPQLLGVYAGVGFAVLQGGDILIDRLGLPDWTFFGLLLVLLAGIPVAVATAFVQSSERSLRIGGLFNWRNTAIYGAGSLAVLGVAVGLFMGARALGIGPVASLVAAGVLDREEPILIADFQSLTGDSALAGAVTEAFRIDFEQSPLVRVVSPGAVREGLLRMQRPPDAPLGPALARELALREGIRAVLLGEVNTAGAASIVSVRLVAPESEEAIVSFRETAADSTEVIAAVDRLSNRLRERVGESLRSIRGGEPLERATTASLTALRRYSQGVRAIDRQRDIAGGIAFLEEAIAEDPSFAMAWRKLGVTLMNEGEDPERWREALTRAYELSDRLTDRERYLTRGTYYGSLLNDSERAIRAYRSLLELHPSDPTALNNLAVQYSGQGDTRQAVELWRRAVATDGASLVAFTNLISNLVSLGEWDEAEAARVELEARFPDVPMGRHMAALLWSARGDYEAAERAAMGLMERGGVPTAMRIQAQAGLVNLALLEGRIEEAYRRWDRLQELQALADPSFERPPAEALHARVAFFVRADTAAALAAVDRFLDSEGLPPEAAGEGVHLELASFYLLGGRLDRARALIAEWDALSEGTESTPWMRERRADVEALLDLKEGRTSAALAHLRQHTQGGEVHPSALLSMARAFEYAEMPDSAAAYFDRYFEQPHLYRAEYDALNLAGALDASARTLEALGDTAAARTRYLRLAELWARADPELQPRVEAARERAASLGGVER